MPSRRRRTVVVVSSALLAGLVVLAGGVFWVLRPDTSPAPATKQAIAAVTVEVLGISPTSYDVNPLFDVPEPLGVEIRWRPDGGGPGDSHYLHPAVERVADADPLRLGCGRYQDCAEWDHEAGRMRLTWQEESPESDPGILTLSLETDEGELRRVTYAGASILGDPRDQDDLPLGIDQLEELLADDRFSATTTQEMVDADLAKWPEDDHSGDAVPTTGAEVAQWAFQDGVTRPADGARPADIAAYGEDAVGAEFRSPGRVTTVVVLPKDSPRVPTCGAGWHCRTQRGVTTGWRRGEVIVIRESDRAAVVGTIRSAEIDRLPTPSWRHGRVGDDFYALENGFAAYGLTTTKVFASDPPRWYRER